MTHRAIKYALTRSSELAEIIQQCITSFSIWEETGGVMLAKLKELYSLTIFTFGSYLVGGR